MTKRLKALHSWLKNDLALYDYELLVASADASFRQYFRLVLADKTYIVMDAPPEQEDCRPFINISQRLLESGLNVPEVFAQDLNRGFLLLGDLGEELYLDILDDSSAEELYADAIRALQVMQCDVSVEGLPVYDETLLLNEMCLFRDWLLKQHLQLTISAELGRQLNSLFDLLIDSARAQKQVFVHRDYHSRNLLINKRNPGIIDFQDAVLGPLTYDLVSLLKDCYIKWPRDRIYHWLAVYQHAMDGRAVSLPQAEQLKRDFDLMGVQRHLKASGIFARLWHRDGKKGYLADVPRTLSYILDLEPDYPELETLVAIIRAEVMPALGEQ